ncbi:radical SAM/SPASM domain-containing protein [candidate division CSSED10-310 bacterium]|uniref:Radical SAM/SPASM domain-containing protein n=1 Tax=candidate division CSSED10-310 bacterium TaxID=2855610 RepID=A0ABV6YSF4_UNCC1
MSHSLLELVSKAWNNHILLSLSLELTYTCDLNCLFCYNDKNKRGRPLTLSKYQQILTQAREMGCLYLTLTGGEPTLHKDFFSIGAFAARAGYFIRLKTHGVFDDLEMVKKIKAELNPAWIDISLHGATAQTYENTTQKSGSYALLLRNLELITAEGIRTRLVCVLTKYNQRQVADIIKIGQQFNMPVNFDLQISPRDNGDISPFHYSAEVEAIAAYFALIKQYDAGTFDFADSESSDLKRSHIRSRYCCGAGAGNLNIDPYGTVFPCIGWKRALGNLRQQNIADLWQNASALQQVRSDNKQAQQFRAENQAKIGRAIYCPGRAELETGSVCSIYQNLARIMAAGKK